MLITIGLLLRPAWKVAVLFFLVGEVVAQVQNPPFRPDLRKDGMSNSDFSFKNEKMGWRVGSYGKMLLTVDGGLTWQRAAVTDEKIYAVSFNSNHDRFWAVGDGGKILKQIGPTKWVEYEDKTYENTSTLWDIEFSRDGRQGLISGQSGNLFRYSADDSETWQKIETPTTYTLYGSTFSDDQKTVVAFGENATVLLSRDEHLNKWEPVLNEDEKRKIFNVAIFSGWISPDGNRLIVGANSGYMLDIDLRSKAVSAHRIARGGIRSLVIDDASGIGWAVSTLGEIFKTTNFGRKWTLDFSVEGDPYLTTVGFRRKPSEAMVMGERDLVLRQQHGTWRSSNNNNLFDVLTVNEETFIAGQKGVYGLQEKDSLVQRAPASVQESFYKLWRDGDWIWTCGTNATIYKFNVERNEWSLEYDKKGGATLRSIYVNEENGIGIAVGEKGQILRKERDGKKWEPLKLTDQLIEYSDVWSDGQTCFIVGEKGTIHKSDDGGRSWHAIAGIPNNIHIKAIDFSSTPSFGYIVGRCTNEKADNHIFKTKDGGETWLPEKNFSDGPHLTDVLFGRNDSLCYVATYQGDIYWSRDRGTNWFQLLPTYTTVAVAALAENDLGGLYAVGSNGLLFTPIKGDSIPTIKFAVIDSANYFKVVLSIKDDKTNPDDIIVKIQVDGEVVAGADEEITTQEITADDIKTLKAIPKSILTGKGSYKLKLSVCDGWNLVTKEEPLDVGETLQAQLVGFLKWNKMPQTLGEVVDTVKVNLIFLFILYGIALFTLYFVAPLKIFYWHEFLSRAKFPYSDKLAPWLGLMLAEQPKVLNAFVDHFAEKAEKTFRANEDVSTRPFWVAAPFNIDGAPYLHFAPTENQQSYIAGLHEIRSHLTEERIIISIDGPGGIGKSSLAFQIARWLGAGTTRKRLLAQRALPLFTNKLDSPIDEICHRKLELLTNHPISDSFVSRLLKTKRVAIVADGVTEMSDFNASYIDPETGAKLTQLIVLTARKPITLPFVVRIVPMGLKLDFIDPLLDGFVSMYVGAFHFGKQRETLRAKVVGIIEEITENKDTAMVPLLILRLAVDKAKRLLDENKSLSEGFPDSFSALIDEYIEDLFRKETNPSELFADLRTASIIAIGFAATTDFSQVSDEDLHKPTAFRPAWLAESFFTEKISRSSLKVLITSGLIVESGTKDDKLLKFTYDPVSEYLAAKAIVIQHRDGKINAMQFQKIADIVHTQNAQMYLVLLSLGTRMGIELPDSRLRIGA